MYPQRLDDCNGHFNSCLEHSFPLSRCHYFILDQFSSDLMELVATCLERAEICRQALAEQNSYATSYTLYQADLRDWQDAHGARGTAPEPPPAPEAAPVWANR
jgi:hypothetical protein